jgi:transitional endoplasmic reticulum ATPase
MEDVSILFLRYEMFYRGALDARSKKNILAAKNNFEKAAEVMFQIAQKSPKNLQQTRVEMVKKLLSLANDLDYEDSSTSIDKKNVAHVSNKMKVASIPNVTFNDIIGLDEVKKSIYTRMILPLQHSEKYKTYNKETGGGVLLYGPPGTGKTTIAKAIANEVGAAFYYVKGSDIMDKFVGESEKNISTLFESARKEKLAIIFVDDMDSLFSKRGVDVHSDERVNEFLQQMDGFSGRAPHVLMLGATNRPWSLDSAVVRPGRFSRQIFIPLPDLNSRNLMIKKFLKDVPVSADLDYDTIATKTKDYSGADLFELCEEAKLEPLMKYIKTNEVTPISNQDFDRSLNKVKSSIRDIDLAEIYNYNKSIGLSNIKISDSLTDSVIVEEISVKESNEESNAVIQHDVKINVFPGKKTQCRFVLAEEEYDLTIIINNKGYVCFKEFGYFISDELDIIKPGLYHVQIMKKEKEIGCFDFELIRGVDENNMGL